MEVQNNYWEQWLSLWESYMNIKINMKFYFLLEVSVIYLGGEIGENVEHNTVLTGHPIT